MPLPDALSLINVVSFMSIAVCFIAFVIDPDFSLKGIGIIFVITAGVEAVLLLILLLPTIQFLANHELRDATMDPHHYIFNWLVCGLHGLISVLCFYAHKQKLKFLQEKD